MIDGKLMLGCWIIIGLSIVYIVFSVATGSTQRMIDKKNDCHNKGGVMTSNNKCVQEIRV